MKPSTLVRTFLITALAAGNFLLITAGRTQPHYVGATAGDCKKCHENEFNVWAQTKHAKSWETLHKSANLKAIVAAVGGDANPRRNTTCTQCHYTKVAAAATASFSVTCESCHGPASDWLKIHNDFGGEGVKREAETAEHKKKRIEESIKAGMLRPDQPYDVAANCLNCHNLGRDSLDGATIAKMIDAGHPINPEYELVRYSQGTVRHRFYPPDITKNAEMTPAELARWLVTGAAVKFVSATVNQKKSDNAKYQETQRKHIENAKAILSAVKSVPEAAGLLAAPTAPNARKLVDAIQGKDLSAEVKGLLPNPAEYK
jgi:hypothetical protein